MPISAAMKTHLAGSATYLTHLFRVEERPRECVIHWHSASAANVRHRGGYLKKINGANLTADAGARSISSYDGDVYVRAVSRFTGQLSDRVRFGLTTSTATPTSGNLSFGIEVEDDPGNNIIIFESGTPVAFPAFHARPGDHLRVQRVGSQITYWLNRTKIYTSAASSMGTLYAAATLEDLDAVLDLAVFGFVPTVIAVTDYTRPLVFGGETYMPLPLMPTRFNHSDGLRPNNAELTHILSSGGVSEADVIGGRWDYSRYEFSAVNYLDLTMGVARRNVGRFGEFRVNTAGYFTVELRSLAEPLAQEIGDIVGSICLARQFGDFRCGQPLDNFIHDTTISSVTNPLVLVLGLTKPNAYFEFGLIRFLSGSNKYYEREIKNNVGSTITLQRPFPFLPVAAQSVTVMAGCNRTRAKCKTFPNPQNPSGTNIENFQAFPDVPGLAKALRYPE